MDDGTYAYVVPLGNLNPPSHVFPTTHIYFGLRSEDAEPGTGPFGDGRVFPAQNVYAVSDGKVKSIAVASIEISQNGATETYQEFDMHIEVCDGLTVRYGHIGPISERLKESLDSEEPWSCHNYSTGIWDVDRCEYNVSWDVESGELIAFTSGRAATFDLGASRVEDGSHQATPICPIDLYEASLQEFLYSDIGFNETSRTIAPLCGTVDYETEHTAEGRWWFGDSANPVEDENIALVYDNIDPRIPVFSIGTTIAGLPSNAYRYTPADSGMVNRLFSDVTPGAGVLCFEDLTNRFGQTLETQIILVEFSDETTLRVEAVDQSLCGTGPWELSSRATSFNR